MLERGRVVDAMLFSGLGDVLQELPAAEVVAVDVPIGLPPPGSRRRADIEARALVGTRRSSVFFAPSAAALAATTYSEAREVDRSLSAQAYALRRAILDAAACDDHRLHEVHPEVSFQALAGRHLHPKRTWNGQTQRRRLLAGAGIALPDELTGGTAPADDVLDAAVAAWSAERIARGAADRLPADAAPAEPTIWF